MESSARKAGVVEMMCRWASNQRAQHDAPIVYDLFVSSSDVQILVASSKTCSSSTLTKSSSRSIVFVVPDSGDDISVCLC